MCRGSTGSGMLIFRVQLGWGPVDGRAVMLSSELSADMCGSFARARTVPEPRRIWWVGWYRPGVRWRGSGVRVLLGCRRDAAEVLCEVFGIELVSCNDQSGDVDA